MTSEATIARPADVPLSGPWADAVMDRIYAEGDRYAGYFVLFHFAVGLGLAPFFDTWLMALSVGSLATAMFFASRAIAPRMLVTRMVAGVSLQAFVALHIYQLHGLPEMHFFFFSAFTMLITYQDPRAPWLGTFLIIGQHIVFAYLENSGVELNYFDGPVGFWKLFFHFGIALLHVGVCSYWAMWLRRKTLTEAWHQQQLDEARQRAEAATATKSRFLATMSHEIRTPMNGVLGMTTLLRGTRLDDEQRGYVDLAHRSGQHLLSVINDILDFSKIEAGRMEVSPEPFDTRAAIDETRQLLASEAQRKGLTLSSVVASDMPALVLADSRMVRQVLLNLVGNALKYTVDGFVRIDATWRPSSEGQGELHISVRDSGIGISGEAIRRLFSEFTQLDTSTTRRYGGSGLGLAISLRLATLMGGAITVESTPGRGSTFTMTLPASVVSRDTEARATAGREPLARPLESLAVLVVEDNPVNQVVAVRLLERQGCRVDLATTGQEAVARCAARPYGVVLMDCYMPEMDGFEATRRIRAADNGRRTPIIALTASVLDTDRQRCLDAGMDAVLPKPVDADALIAAVRQFTTNAAAVP
jgi:CheY-like chemotaxis protein/nitrogen-specific signal transduction histidine kinase